MKLPEVNADLEHRPEGFELNLAPIIDCFTVLIAYLLVSASFLSLVALDVGAAAPTAPALAAMENKPTLEVHVLSAANHRLTLRGQSTTPLGDSNGKLAEAVEQAIQSHPEIREVTVRAEPGIPYGTLVRAIEEIKTRVPAVFLAAGR